MATKDKAVMHAVRAYAASLLAERAALSQSGDCSPATHRVLLALGNLLGWHILCQDTLVVLGGSDFKNELPYRLDTSLESASTKTPSSRF